MKKEDYKNSPKFSKTLSLYSTRKGGAWNTEKKWLWIKIKSPIQEGNLFMSHSKTVSSLSVLALPSGDKTKQTDKTAKLRVGWGGRQKLGQ